MEKTELAKQKYYLCPDCGEVGYQTTLSPDGDSYACNKCRTWWVING
jgi:predicted RNA-binding Zn-ribbon protein involved in translation (DUF1610 family)